MSSDYIHSNNIVHPDIKPAIILVSNMHYFNLTRETAYIFKTEPIIGKLVELGEDRSKVLQTSSNNSRTQFVRRASPAYMTPEIFAGE